MTWKGRWLAIRARLSLAKVVILIADGRLRCLRGSLPPALLGEFKELVRTRGVKDALITASGGNGGTSLSFSSNVDPSTQQRFRNVWFAYPDRKMMGV